MKTVDRFKTYCRQKDTNLTPCQVRLADLYFNDKEEFAKTMVLCPVAAGRTFLFRLIGEFERMRTAEKKKICNVRTLP